MTDVSCKYKLDVKLLNLEILYNPLKFHYSAYCSVNNTLIFSVITKSAPIDPIVVFRADNRVTVIMMSVQTTILLH